MWIAALVVCGTCLLIMPQLSSAGDAVKVDIDFSKLPTKDGRAKEIVHLEKS